MGAEKSQIASDVARTLQSRRVTHLEGQRQNEDENEKSLKKYKAKYWNDEKGKSCPPKLLEADYAHVRNAGHVVMYKNETRIRKIETKDSKITL